jgi:phosphoribosyl 1,2-cyclic phosphodiesterase
MERFTANIEIRELREMMFRVGKLPVQTAFAHHPGVTVGYRLGTPAGGVVYLPDNEIMPIGRKCPVESDASTDQFNNYKNQLLVEFAKGAEVFIADAQYTIDEYALRFGWGHSCIDDTVRIAIQAKVKRLVLFHHDPARDDDSMDRLLSYAQDLAASDGGGLVVEAAQEGQEIQLAARVRQKTTPATVAG